MDAWKPDVSLIVFRRLSHQLMCNLSFCDGLFLTLDSFEQLMERVGEFLDAFILQLLGDLFVQDAKLL
jgi:hypothetical protein